LCTTMSAVTQSSASRSRANVHSTSSSDRNSALRRSRRKTGETPAAMGAIACSQRLASQSRMSLIRIASPWGCSSQTPQPINPTAHSVSSRVGDAGILDQLRQLEASP
jgi:hypothetical protein